MQTMLRANLAAIGRIAHALSLYAVTTAACVALGAAILAALGVLPWLDLPASFGDGQAPRFGTYLQLGLTALLWLMVGALPSGSRMLALERSHRDFRVSMGDVARAYHVAHAGDRGGAFALSSEFDMVRERIEYLRDHPDLRLLEADVLTLAAQMSQQSHKLALIYSDDKVARARDFLQQRQAEAEEQQRRIVEALGIAREIGRWSSAVETEEAMVASQLQALEEQLRAVLPSLGHGLDGSGAQPDAESQASASRLEVARAKVVAMGSRPAAE